MIRCPSCNAKQIESSNFCSECGAALAPDLSATVACQLTPSPREEQVDRSRSDISQISQHGRFLPGTKIVDRYRIVSLIGRGGMGEVYRADDLKLGHTVALKFLPKDLAKDPKRLEYFHSEVRLTRQVSHPNVCRVYDIGEVDGQQFLSMEYIDGEDLRILLRRIGRLPKDKGVQIAQQLCAGLAAAHDKGVLHRDLKPANIMIDGRGQVRITDFGLAKLASDGDSREVAGTPAYMAPEQLSRGQATIQSDLYSLGLILYELFTGEAVHKTSSIPDLLQQHEQSSPSQPSGLVDDMDPVTERAILRCLEKEPSDRPNHARAVAASLPGGDPLAAALAAGETPSPEMVAASGAYTSLRPRVALLLLFGVVTSLILIAWIAGPRRYVSGDGVVKPLVVLHDIATRIVRDDLGYDDNPLDTAYDFADSSSPGQSDLRFWYRQRSDSTLNHLSLYEENALDVYGRATFQLPAWQVPGELGLKLTTGGQLQFFRAIPPVEVSNVAEVTDPNGLPWTTWFPQETTGYMLGGAELQTNAGLSDSDGALLEWIPGKIRTTPDASDAVRVWRGVDERTEQEVYVVAAAFRQRPVYYEAFTAAEFEQTDPSSTEFEMMVPRVNRVEADYSTMVGCANALLIVAGILAIYNIRMGRGDRRGAFRAAIFALCVSAVAAICMAHRAWITTPVFPLLAQCVLDASFIWLMYVALEPFVRRTWPRMLVASSRLVAGRFQDPAVGQSLLVGVFAGLCVNLNANLATIVAEASGSGLMVPLQSHAYMLSGSKEILGYICFALIERIFRVALMLLVLLLLRAIVPSKSLALFVGWIVLAFLAMVVVGLPLTSTWGWYFVAVAIAIDVAILVRFGFLAAVVTVVTQDLAAQAPLTLDSGQSYFGNGLLVMMFLILAAAYGCYTSLGGRSFVQGLAK